MQPISNINKCDTNAKEQSMPKIKTHRIYTILVQNIENYWGNNA